MKKLIFAVLITVCLAGCQSQPRAEKANSENSGSIQQVIYDSKDLDQLPTVRGIQPSPVFPADLKMRRITGEVMLQFIVNPSGNVQDVKVVSSTNKGFEQSAIEAVQKWKFKPGIKNGEAVYASMQLPISYDFWK